MENRGDSPSRERPAEPQAGPLNPFETPATEPVGPAEARVHGAHGRFRIGLAFAEGWDATWDSFPLWLGVLVVAWIVHFAAGLTLVGYLLISPVVTFGHTLFFLNALDRRATFSDLFAGFSKYGAALGGMLLLGLVFFGPSVLAVGALGFLVEAPSSAWSLAVFPILAPLVVVLPRLGFAPFFLVDQGMRATDALRASWAATAEQKLAVVVLALLSALVALAGTAALGVGVLASSTVAALAWVSAYRQVAGSTP